MTTTVRLLLAIAALIGLGTSGYPQDLKTDGVLKGPDKKVAAALAFAPENRAVVAYVVKGTSENEKSKKKTNWSEVRLMDLATGKYRVLHRAETPEGLPGIPANHTLRGFTADGKKVAVTTTDPGGTDKELLLEVVEPKAKDKEKK
jgi:hypothetical protein